MSRFAGEDRISGHGFRTGSPGKRQVVDYSLQKRALLREVYAGRVGTYEVCDASPYLLSAARFHGDPTEERCPVCRRENVTHVHYIYGDELKQSAGQARSRLELPVLAKSVRQIQVYVVEVCRGCGWNHLVEQFLLGRSAGSPDSLDDAAAVGANSAAGGGQQRAAARQPGSARGARECFPASRPTTATPSTLLHVRIFRYI